MFVGRDNLYAQDADFFVLANDVKRLKVERWTAITTIVIPTFLAEFQEIVCLAESLDIIFGSYFCRVSLSRICQVFAICSN